MSVIIPSPDHEHTPAFDQVVIFHNPNSRHARDAQQHIDDICDNTPYHHPYIIESDADEARTHDVLRRTLQDGQLLYVLGGDGSINSVTQLLGDRKLMQSIGNVTLLTSNIGNACDIHTSLTEPTHSQSDRPSTILAHARTTPIHPLEVSVHGEKPSRRLALGYASIGATALGAWLLDSEEHRNNPLRNNDFTALLYEGSLLARHIPLRSRMLEVTREDDEMPTHIYDVIAANSSHMAKKLRFQTEITSHELLMSTVDRKRQLISAFTRFVQGTYPYTRIQPGESTAITVSPHNPQEATFIQYDGEATPLTPGSTVEFRLPTHYDLHTCAINALTKHINNQEAR